MVTRVPGGCSCSTMNTRSLSNPVLRFPTDTANDPSARRSDSLATPTTSHDATGYGKSNTALHRNPVGRAAAPARAGGVGGGGGAAPAAAAGVGPSAASKGNAMVSVVAEVEVLGMPVTAGGGATSRASACSGAKQYRGATCDGTSRRSVDSWHSTGMNKSSVTVTSPDAGSDPMRNWNTSGVPSASSAKNAWCPAALAASYVALACAFSCSSARMTRSPTRAVIPVTAASSCTGNTYTHSAAAPSLTKLCCTDSVAKLSVTLTLHDTNTIGMRRCTTGGT